MVKKKIGGATLAEDCKRIEAVLKHLAPGQPLARSEELEHGFNAFAVLNQSSTADFFLNHRVTAVQARSR